MFKLPFWDKEKIWELWSYANENHKNNCKNPPYNMCPHTISANADVTIPFFLNVKIVQAYCDTSFLWRGFEITKPSVCCHLLLLWKWICQVSWKQISNKPLLWKIMYNFCWWCQPSITVCTVELSYSASSAHESALRTGIQPVLDSFGCIISLSTNVNKEQYI